MYIRATVDAPVLLCKYARKEYTSDRFNNESSFSRHKPWGVQSQATRVTVVTVVA